MPLPLLELLASRSHDRTWPGQCFCPVTMAINARTPVPSQHVSAGVRAGCFLPLRSDTWVGPGGGPARRGFGGRSLPLSMTLTGSSAVTDIHTNERY